MKKILYLAALFVLIYGGYQYLRAYFDFNALSARIDVIISDPKSYTPDSMVKFIVEEAEKQGIPLSGEDIEIAISETDKASLGEALIERSGIDVESKLLTIRFHYPITIFGFTRTFTYDIEKVFTSKASITNRYEDME